MSMPTTESSSYDIYKFVNLQAGHLTEELEQISDLLIGLQSNKQSSESSNASPQSRIWCFFTAQLIGRWKRHILIAVFTSIAIFLIWSLSYQELASVPVTNLKSKYVIENLKGDTIDTWKSWKWIKYSPMDVVIINDAKVPNSKLDIVNSAILSEEALKIDNSVLHKGPQGTFSTYYLGWQGALAELERRQTEYDAPVLFNIHLADRSNGRIVITLTDMIDSDGYSGYTKSTISENEILKAHITIYNANNLSDEQLATITRHEFGHALGLGHSTAPEDLMAPAIGTLVPYISECNVDALEQLYNGSYETEVACQN